MSSLKTCHYSVSGTHCRSCEILIENEIKKLPQVKSVSASSKNGHVSISYRQKPPSLQKLNQIFASSGYAFSTQSSKSSPKSSNPLKTFALIAILISIFIFLNYSGFTSLVSVNQQSLLPSFFFFGILAGFSTCAALVGGLLLSVSKVWTQDSTAFSSKIRPFLYFNLSRLLSFTFFGYLLGLLGQFFNLSLSGGAILSILVSLLLIGLSLQMLGIKSFANFQFTLPKNLTGKIVNQNSFSKKHLPFATGFLSFFLPCGFTLTAQSLALASGVPLRGALILFFFALGTALPLLIISFTSAKFANSKHSSLFSTVAGSLVLIFSLFTINSQLLVLNLPSLSFNQIKLSSAKSDDSLPPLVNGKQVVKMLATSSGYSPSVIKVKQGVPVVWEIDGTRASGCTNAIISRQLFPDTITLSPYDTTVFEFTPQKKGTYRFSCWMGMVNGTIEVI